jgi:hypothetical protein
MESGKELSSLSQDCRVLAAVYSASDQAKATHCYNEFLCVYATMQDAISVTEAQVTESAYVWTNSKNVHLEWDPAALYFDARDNLQYGKMVNDSWSDEGNNCTISSTYMMQQVGGGLRHCNMRQRAHRVKIMLDWECMDDA